MRPRLLLSVLAVTSVICSPIEAQPQPNTVTIDQGIALHYVEVGEGVPVVFVHGLLDDYTAWLQQMERFAAAGYRAISYSRRHNFPNENPIRANHSASLEADDLARMVRKLELGRVHVVGFSYGAYTTLFFGLKHPELARSLTLAEPPIVPWLQDLEGPQAPAAKRQFEKLHNDGVMPAQRAMQSGDSSAAIRSMLDAIAKPGHFNRLPEFVKAKCRRNIGELKAFLQSDDRYPNVNREDVRKLTIPTLILSGGDSIATSQYTDPELERLIPRESRERVIFEGGTHIFWIQQPVRFRQTILDFHAKHAD